MSGKFLITRPRHDRIVNYLFFWSDDIIDFAKGKNINPIDLGEKKATRGNVESYLDKQNPILVMFNGHGTPHMICGHQDEPLIAINDNEHILKSRIVYALSCDAGAELGESACKKGCESFIGYGDKFGFVNESDRECSPQKDRFAAPFREFSNTITLSLLNGATVEESVEKAKRKSTELIKRYSTSDVEPGHKEIRFWLFWDRFFLKHFGSSSAKLQ